VRVRVVAVAAVRVRGVAVGLDVGRVRALEARRAGRELAVRVVSVTSCRTEVEEKRTPEASQVPTL
jgi:hypothetical protein